MDEHRRNRKFFGTQTLVFKSVRANQRDQKTNSKSVDKQGNPWQLNDALLLQKPSVGPVVILLDQGCLRYGDGASVSQPL